VNKCIFLPLFFKQKSEEVAVMVMMVAVVVVVVVVRLHQGWKNLSFFGKSFLVSFRFQCTKKTEHKITTRPEGS